MKLDLCFDRPPYHKERFPLGFAICNRDGFNCASYGSGSKFVTEEVADEVVSALNNRKENK